MSAVAKRSEIQREIEQLYADYRASEQPTDGQHGTVQRNILLFGSSKSGKTTLINVLTDPTHVPNELSLRAEPQNEPIPHPHLHLPSSNVVVDITEIPADLISPRSDLSEIRTQCQRLRTTDFHLICLCVSFETGINGAAVQSFERLIDYLGAERVRPNLCFVITRCESKDDAQRAKLVNELREDADFKRIWRYAGRGVCFSGALNRDDWNRANESLIDQFETIYAYRAELIRQIEADVEPFHLPSPPTLTPTPTPIPLPTVQTNLLPKRTRRRWPCCCLWRRA